MIRLLALEFLMVVKPTERGTLSTNMNRKTARHMWRGGSDFW